MKSCSYCGRESPDSSLHCIECGTYIEPPPPPRAEALGLQPFNLQQLQLITPERLDPFLFFSESFHRVDWPQLYDWIAKNIEPADQFTAWQEAAFAWASKLRDDLGGTYSVVLSPHTILLCDESPDQTVWLLDFIGRTIRAIRDRLGPVAWPNGSLLKLLLVFAEEDDYYHYIANYYTEGAQASSGGICIHDGYTHIAFPMHTQMEAAYVIAHELVHDSLSQLHKIPKWLNEALALTIERKLMPDLGHPIVTAEQADQHHRFWNQQNIQYFWAGQSFQEPGDTQTLSYNLAEILLALVLEGAEPTAFYAFLNQAHYSDAGQTSALDNLDVDLGALAATFLGEGHWRPNRKAIANLHGPPSNPLQL